GMMLRAALTAVCVLVSMLLVVAPSWAAKGNSANAKLCEAGGYPGVLFNQKGETFKNEGACTKYAAKGGKLAGLDAVSGPVSEGVFTETCSGFGLAEGSSVLCEAVYGPIGLGQSGGPVEAGGTFSLTVPNQGCVEGGLGIKVSALAVEAHTAEEAPVRASSPPPSGC